MNLVSPLHKALLHFINNKQEVILLYVEFRNLFISILNNNKNAKC